MSRSRILPKSADIVDRLRAHAFRMIENETIAMNGVGYCTEGWEQGDLEAVLDAAADEIERLRNCNN